MNELATSPHCTMCLDTGIYIEKARCPKCCGYRIANNKVCIRCHGSSYIYAEPKPCPFCKKNEENHELST